jgi:hypothetical protein
LTISEVADEIPDTSTWSDCMKADPGGLPGTLDVWSFVSVQDANAVVIVREDEVLYFPTNRLKGIGSKPPFPD